MAGIIKISKKRLSKEEGRKINHPSGHVEMRLVLQSKNTEEITIFYFNFIIFIVCTCIFYLDILSVHSMCAWSP